MLGELQAALGLFERDDPERLRELVDQLVGRAWLRRTVGGLLKLTAEGRRAHQEIENDVQQIRAQVAGGVNEGEYQSRRINDR
jgi:hypothetical protein